MLDLSTSQHQSAPPHLRIVASTTPATESRDFDEVFKRYCPYVASIALRIFGKSDDVDDVVQDVFMVAHRNLSQLEEASKLKPWLATITVRKSMVRLKRQRLRRFFSLDDYVDTRELCAPGASVETYAEVQRLYRAMRAWSPDERVVWTLREVEGSTLDEIVSYTGLSKSTVQRKLRQVEKRLSERSQDE